MNLLPLLLPATLLPWALPAGAFGVLAAGMTLLWLWQRHSRNAAIVDIGWTVGLGLLGVGYAILLDGAVLRRVLLGSMVGVWALRLAAHLVRDRVRGQPEEGRYRRMREHFGARAQPVLLLFFLAQALLAVLLSLAFLPGLLDKRTALDGFDGAGLLIWVVALMGESVADRQLARFKSEPDSAGRVCEQGLWGWSRHPNYFFEWLIWCAFILPGWPAAGGWIAILAPLAMLVFVLKVTGIPTCEAQALRSRGDAYRAYQQRVSAFLPLPPRPGGAS